MIPLRSSERVYSRTVVTGTLIAINTVIFLYQDTLSYYRLDQFVSNWGIVPDDLHLITLFTSMFLHGGWLHLLGNMLFLWVFGRNLEDLIGGTRFLVFYLVCGLVAGVVQVLANPYARVPTIGASGAIAGVMGAYLIKFPALADRHAGPAVRFLHAPGDPRAVLLALLVRDAVPERL